MITKELDAHLGNLLLNYAHVVAEVLIESFWGYPIYGRKKGLIKRELDCLDKISNEYMNRLRNYQLDYQIFQGYEKLKSQKERDNFLIDKFYINPHFEYLTQRKEELADYCSVFSANDTKGRPVEKKYKIAAIWSSKMRSPKKIYWSKVLGLLDWFFERLKDTAYGEELKIRDTMKDRPRYLKSRCFPLVKKDIMSAIVRLALFFPGYVSVNKKFNVYSINFKKDSIEISGVSGKTFSTRRVKFRKDNIFYSGEYSIPKKIPSISFPGGEIYQPSTSKEILISALNFLSN